MKKTPSGRLVLPGGVFASLGDMLEVAQSLIDVGDVGKGVGKLPENIVELPFIPEENLAAVQALFQKEDRPTAILVSDDLFAVALERVCIEMGIRIPEDLSIISFNNSLFARITSPSLTSIDINSVQLGIEAASQVINHIENPNLLATKIIVPHKLVERNSCINR